MAQTFRGYQSLVENSPDAISLINEDGKILYGSASNTKLFGYTPDEMVGKDCLELIHPEDRDQASFLLEEIMATPPGPRSWDVRIRTKSGGYRWVESTVSNLIHDLQVQALVMHQRDIDERIEARENRQKRAEELVNANLRMEEFAYTVAHDLREPLRAISVYTQLLFAKDDLTPQRKEMAEFVIEGASRMTRMIADLLAFAQTGIHAPPVSIDVGHAAAQALKNLALEIQESGALITLGKLPTIDGNETHLVSLFQNLISNSIKYRGKQPPRIEIWAEQREADWAIRIKDNGLGIETLHQEKIFIPFVRLDSRQIPGTGLGLAVCKKIVEGFGGTIWVDSEPGSGSTFSFSLGDQSVLSNPAVRSAT